LRIKDFSFKINLTKNDTDFDNFTIILTNSTSSDLATVKNNLIGVAHFTEIKGNNSPVFKFYDENYTFAGNFTDLDDMKVFEFNKTQDF
jgi:hypothetical protein